MADLRNANLMKVRHQDAACFLNASSASDFARTARFYDLRH